MATRPRRRQRFSQPSQAVPVNSGLPEAQMSQLGIQWVFNAATIADLPKKTGPHGIAGNSATVDGYKLAGTTIGSNKAYTGMTLMYAAYIDGTADTSNEHYGIRFNSGNSNNCDFGVGLDAFAGNATLKASIVYSDFTGTTITGVAHGISVATRQLVVFTVVFKVNDAAGLRVYVNGILKSTAATSNKNVFATNVDAYASSAAGGSTTQALLLYAGFFALRAFSDAEVAALGSIPAQFFSIFGPKKRNKAATGGTNTYTLSPSGGYTFSGSSPNLRTRAQIPNGGYVFSGAAALIRTRILAPVGSLLFGSSAPQLRTRVQVPSGTLQFSGTAPISFTPAGGSTNYSTRTLMGAGT